LKWSFSSHHRYIFWYTHKEFIVTSKLGFKFEWCTVPFQFIISVFYILRIKYLKWLFFFNPIVVIQLQTILFERCNSVHLLLKYRDGRHSKSSQLYKLSQNLNIIDIKKISLCITRFHNTAHPFKKNPRIIHN